jgi:hypothetical protein
VDELARATFSITQAASNRRFAESDHRAFVPPRMKVFPVVGNR